MPEIRQSITRYALILDGQATPLHDVDGGLIRASVATIREGTQPVARKQISGMQYEPFRIRTGLSMSKALMDWIKGAATGTFARKNGSIAVLNIENKVQSYRNFRNALIEEITVPSLDATSSAAAFLTVTIKPEEITYAKGDNAAIRIAVGAAQKAWIASNFAVRVGQLPCARTSKVESFAMRRSMAGQMPIVDYPNLKLTISDVDMDQWQSWFTDFVVNGNNDQAKELQGSIDFLSPAREVIGSVELSQIGIFALEPEKSTAGTAAVARFSVELYVEKMGLTIK